jgi:antitoxin component YwqK of YwqJK toxin-antitoxin module
MGLLLQLMLLLVTTGFPAAHEKGLMAHGDLGIKVEAVQEDGSPIPDYDRFTGHSDSLRWCGQGLCNGWVLDQYPGGALRHRGYYEDGRLTFYRNFYPSGQVERVFSTLKGRRSMLYTYNASGTLFSESRFYNGNRIQYQDYHTNGRLRYFEEKHHSEPYYLRMGSYRSNSEPITLLRMVDRRKVVYVMREYHNGGVVGAEGPLRYFAGRRSTLRDGVWRIYDVEGRLLRKDHYVSGELQQK